MTDQVHYAIGDVHGEAEKLAQLHDFIREDAARLGVAPHFVHLGDLVDRGPDSRAVVQRVMSLGAEHVCLKGNHEEMMLSAYARAGGMDEYSWAINGGEETTASYERFNGAADDWRDSVDSGHMYWMRSLPVIWHDEDRRIVFVHAGIDPHRYPNCSDEFRMWSRSRIFFKSEGWPKRAELEGLLVVHGHTPTEDFEPEVQRRRINVDTGACYGGPLTCVVLAPGEQPRFLYAR